LKKLFSLLKIHFYHRAITFHTQTHVSHNRINHSSDIENKEIKNLIVDSIVNIPSQPIHLLFNTNTEETRSTVITNLTRLTVISTWQDSYITCHYI